MDLEERTDGLYLLGRRIDAYKIPRSTVMQVDVRLKDGDCPERHAGDEIMDCHGDCQNTYLAFVFDGDELLGIGELAKTNMPYVKMDVIARYGANSLIDAKRLLQRPDVSLRRVQYGRGIEALIGKEAFLVRFDQCTFHHVSSGLEKVYAAELFCIRSNLGRIRRYATKGWPPEVIRLKQGMN